MAELNTILSPTLFGKKLIRIATRFDSKEDIEEDCGIFVGYDSNYYMTLDNENILRTHCYRYNAWKFV